MNYFFIVLVSLMASLLTFEFSKIKNMGSIRASSILTLLFFVDLNIINHFYAIDIQYWLAVFFGGTFLGMSSHIKFKYVDIFIASFIYSLLFVFMLPHLFGIGGALGFSAFLSIVLIRLIHLKHSITLRSFNEDDYDFLCLMLQDDEVMKSTGIREAQSDEQVRNRLLSWSKASDIWCCEYRQEPVGWGMLKVNNDQCEIGYMLPKKYWGLGFGKGIAKKLISLKPEESLFARVDSYNKASIKILKNLGFSYSYSENDLEIFKR